MFHKEAPRSQFGDWQKRIAGYDKKLAEIMTEQGDVQWVPLKAIVDVSNRSLRSFSLGEVAEILGVSGSYLRQLSLDGLGPTPALGIARRRSYTLRQINELRDYLASARPKDALKFCPHRREGEKLQIIAIPDGPGATTTSLYLTEALALKGFRVLAVDLDRSAKLSKMFGYFTSHMPGANASMYGALRFDDPLSMRSVIEKTYFHGVHVVLGSVDLAVLQQECTRRHYSGNLNYASAGIGMVRAFKEVEEDYDVVIIRCGDDSFLTAGALEAATGVLATTRAQLAPAWTSINDLRYLLCLNELAGSPVSWDFFKVLVTMYNPRDVLEQGVFAQLRQILSDDLLTTTVLKSDAIRQAWNIRRSLYELSAGEVGRSAYEQAMETLTSANEEVMDIICKVWGRPPIYASQPSRRAVD
ncbi:replication protein RepA (plasmid) [Rhizobium leguminosarum bv. trifolii CB782]|nr:replication protein RepA [Rhizobium leguminosarum bv. trifolii CB782]